MVSFCTAKLPDYRSLQCFLSNEEAGFVGISHCYFFRFLFNLERPENREGCNDTTCDPQHNTPLPKS